MPAPRINFVYGRRIGSWLKVPPGERVIVEWNQTGWHGHYEDTRGLLEEDHRTIRLIEPGDYDIRWRVTYSRPGPGMRKTSLQWWSPDAADDDGWLDWTDGNEVASTGEGYETTLVGSAIVPSDGRHRIRILTNQASGRELALSDRTYECGVHVRQLS